MDKAEKAKGAEKAEGAGKAKDLLGNSRQSWIIYFDNYS
jgi:hypothetical protein